MPETGRSIVARLPGRVLLGAALLALVLLAAAAGWWLQRAIRFVPAFYRESLTASPAILRADGERFERQVLELANSLRHPGAWQLRLTDDEVNGWLGATLPAVFPELLPASFDQPRVKFEKGPLRFATRRRVSGISTIVSLSCEAWLTDQPDELAVRLVHCRAGRLPLPLALVRGQVASAAARSPLLVRWTEEAGSPVAIVRMPPPKAAGGIARRLAFTRLQIDDGVLIIEGRIEEPDPPDSAAAATAQSSESDTTQR
jgi:hypothetical protein